ncbi:MAG: CTP synthase, partial [Rickettsiales bacterium]|nr:CTP synthase [Rickettsiales bacterium]
GLDKQVLKRFGLPIEIEGKTEDVHTPDLSKWQKVVDIVNNTTEEVNIAIIGKYIGLKDAYKSIIESFSHAGIANKVQVNLIWVDARTFNKGDKTPETILKDVHGILVPGGFGTDGSSGKRAAITYAREANIPFFGICFGMQLAVIEFARNVAQIEGASSSEFGECSEPVVGLMREWNKDGKIETRLEDHDLGGTMRLGAYECKIDDGTRAYDAYGKTSIYERHRHRYEVNINYRETLEKQGLRFSGLSPDGKLPEIVELNDHPWFVGVQFHPEFKSRPFEPHPLFASFVKAAMQHADIETDNDTNNQLPGNVEPLRR